MATIDWDKKKEDIARVVRPNGNEEINGGNLQETLFGMVDSSIQVESESIARDEALGRRIDTEGADLTALTERVKTNEGAIQDHETRIQDNASNIAYNEEEIGRVAGIVDGHSQDITDIKHKDAEQDAAIENLLETTQIKDLDVEVRNTGFGWVSSNSAEEIYAHAIKGGNVKIQINDKKYTFVEYRQRTAYFRYVNVEADRVTEDSIEIYEKQATFKTIEYKAIFDASPLLVSFQKQEPLTTEFISALDKALAEKKLVYVNGTDAIYLLIATSRAEGRRSFTGVGGRTAYVLSYGSNRIVSLDTHTIGGNIHIFNNENSVNILNLTTESTNEEIKEVFTDSFGEVVIPHANDVFNIYQNSDVSNNGVVESMVDDAYEVRLAVNMSNFENNLIHRVFYAMSYNPSVGVNSLRITQKIDNVLNPSKLTEEAMDARDARLTAVEKEVAGVNVVLDRIIGE